MKYLKTDIDPIVAFCFNTEKNPATPQSLSWHDIGIHPQSISVASHLSDFVLNVFLSAGEPKTGQYTPERNSWAINLQNTLSE